MRLTWLYVSNRVRNWNKVKNFIFVESKLELFQLEMLIIIYKLMCQFINELVSFLFCEFNCVTSWKEGKNIILKEPLVLMCLASHFDIIETWKWMLDIRTFITQKNIKFFYVCKLEFFLKMCNTYEAHIFPRPLQQTCRFETTPLCLITRLLVNKQFQNSHKFYWN